MTTPAARLALGLDIGGTSTRALVIDSDGNRLGWGRSDGANLTSHALDRALDAVSAAVDQALADVDPGLVAAAVIGAAGERNLFVPAIARAFADRWQRAKLTCDYEVVPDAVVAFVAGTPEPDGTLVLSGTGALAARLEDRRTAHVIDAHGWLLGDLGSGFWIGRHAVMATLSALDRHTAPGPLGTAVVQTLLGTAEFDPRTRDVAADLVLAVHDKPPVALAGLAPLVTGYAGVDAEADRILREAAGHLMRETGYIRAAGETTPIVLAGSLLTTDTPLAALVKAQLATSWPDATVSLATDGAAGAAWFAAMSTDPHDTDRAVRLHAALF